MLDSRYERLEKQIIDMIREEQIKLGYQKETVRLYYPLLSLNRYLKTEDTVDEMQSRLEAFALSVECTLGKIRITHKKERFCVMVPPEGVDYVHEEVKEDLFLKGFCGLISSHGTKIEDVEAYFRQFSNRVHFEKMEDGEFDFLLYFQDGDPDDYRYCIADEGIHLTYHRFLEEDFIDF